FNPVIEGRQVPFLLLDPDGIGHLLLPAALPVTGTGIAQSGNDQDVRFGDFQEAAFPPKTRSKIASTFFRWKDSSNMASMASGSSAADTTGSALSRVANRPVRSPLFSQTF